MTEAAVGPSICAKPLLTLEEQVEDLERRGVAFELCSKEEARSYLAEHTYFFKLTAFRALFKRRVGGARDGQYVRLDFEYLRRLAALDRDMRYALLQLTLDVEHAARTKLMRIVTEREDEDGYSLSLDYFESLNHKEKNRRKGEVAALAKDAYCGELVAKYGSDPATIPVWVLLELFSFGGFRDLYLFCAERWGDRAMVGEHYMLRQAQSVRNACAHSSDVLNGFARMDATVETDSEVQRALSEAGFSHRVRTSRMRSARVQQIATLLYLHARMVPDGAGKRRAARDMHELRAKIDKVTGIAGIDNSARAPLLFLADLIDKWF
ncbi:Abi family protein [Paratractidigestivibacter sp.]|uniref:Abi family protein n=2 Tax=Paratractidigestivibacter sp. TaxID=2847316 RepID=UPI002AC97186|nr:Abi family protein [Paratractidigestivibacter sp.]